MKRQKTQPTYKRQRFLLSFINCLSGNVLAADLHNLVFLQVNEDESASYIFIPTQSGPYSLQLQEDIEILARDGFVTLDDSLGGLRVGAASDYREAISYQIVPERGDALTQRILQEFPYYHDHRTCNTGTYSGNNDNGSRVSYKNKEEPILFTIGYEGKTIESFLNTLLLNDVRLLCDVRKNPLSRKFGFSKRKLEQATKLVGIKYIHLADLGIESEKRSSLETCDDYRALFAEYEKTLPNKQPILDEVFDLLQEVSRIALMCFELESEMCHRHVIRDRLTETTLVKSVDL